jgi:hypothetical protein
VRFFKRFHATAHIFGAIGFSFIGKHITVVVLIDKKDHGPCHGAWSRRLHIAAAVLANQANNAWDCAKPVFGGVLAGQDADHARHRQGRVRLDTGDAGVRMRRADENRVQRAVANGLVVREATGAANKPMIFEPGQRTAPGSAIERHKGCFLLLHGTF